MRACSSDTECFVQRPDINEGLAGLKRQIGIFQILSSSLSTLSERAAYGSTIIVKSRRADVSGLRPDQPSIAKLLQAVRGPTEDTPDGERWRTIRLAIPDHATTVQCKIRHW